MAANCANSEALAMKVEQLSVTTPSSPLSHSLRSAV